MTLYKEALERFDQIFKKVQKKKLEDPTAMTLATADAHGRPSARVVLLKSYDERGFVFFTNQKSQKGRQLQENPHAALCFYWDSHDDQIRVEGVVEPVSVEEADAYWVTRPRNSQIGAWASLQSDSLDKRRTFLKRIAQFALKFAARPVPRPPHWSGYRLVPRRIEFWKKKPFRLHERTLYEKKNGEWTARFLYP